jgi:hypothetical protein
LTLDGVDLRSIDRTFLHQTVALVAQEPLVFAESIEYNITFGVHRQVTRVRLGMPFPWSCCWVETVFAVHWMRSCIILVHHNIWGAPASHTGKLKLVPLLLLLLGCIVQLHCAASMPKFINLLVTSVYRPLLERNINSS